MADPQTTRPSMQRIAELQQLVAEFSRVERAIQLADTGRKENDVDHSFGLALTCWFLAPKIAPQLDLLKILQYALAHDIVELHSGDTFIFAEAEHLSSKSDREDNALKRLAEDWPDFPELTDYARGYKDKRDAEALFVKAIDKILPILMVNLGEKDKLWNRLKITTEMMKQNKRPTVTISPEVAPYYDELVAWATNPDYFYKPEPKTPPDQE